MSIAEVGIVGEYKIANAAQTYYTMLADFLYFQLNEIDPGQRRKSSVEIAKAEYERLLKEKEATERNQMSDNNGHEDAGVKAERLKQEKIARFNENPDNFVCIEDIVLGFVKEDGRIGVFAGNFSRGEIKNAHAELDYKYIKTMMLIEAEMAEESPKIINPGQPIMSPVDFARRKR